jgi:CRP-like cAMP-binding protein
MSEVEVDAGAEVMTLDDYGTAIYFIEEGHADVLTDRGEAAQTLGPGDTFGEIALLLTGQRTATVVARTTNAPPLAFRSELPGHPSSRT